MKAGYTHIEVVLDRSGSMMPLTNDVIGGFNTFIKEQQAVPGECTIELVQFDDRYEPGYNGPLAKFPMLTNVAHDKDHTSYVPRGSTALLHAVGKTMRLLGERLSKMDEKDRPEKVIFVIQTDGQENTSHEMEEKHTYESVAKQIKLQEEIYKWQFLFLGAGLDVAKQGVQMNVGNSVAYNATARGMASVYHVSSQAIAGARIGTRSVTLSVDEKNTISSTK